MSDNPQAIEEPGIDIAGLKAQAQNTNEKARIDAAKLQGRNILRQVDPIAASNAGLGTKATLNPDINVNSDPRLTALKTPSDNK